MSTQRRRFDRIPQGEPRLLEGARLFNAGFYFEAHETWESLWHEVGGEERKLLQGLIQMAAAYWHLGRGNLPGALYLYQRSRVRLARWGPAHAGIAIDEILAQMDRQLASGADLPPLSRPTLRIEP